MFSERGTLGFDRDTLHSLLKSGDHAPVKFKKECITRFAKCNSFFIIIIIIKLFMQFFGEQLYTWSGFLDARAVFGIVVERVDI